MLSISNIGVKQAGSYYEKDGYYARLDDTDNRWFGELKDKLALPDNINKTDFDAVIGSIDQKANYKEKETRIGMDMCFSAPKSVSIAMILDDQIKNDMIAAHNKAVESILDQIEKNEIGTRITKDKKTWFENTENMICGRFNHYVSRANDPQLHTHCVVFNITEKDGKIYAIDNKKLYQNKIMYGQLYRNALAAELMQQGYEIVVTNSEKGFFELNKIPESSIEHFSSRRNQIEDELKKMGVFDAKSSAKATLKTRQAKEHKDLNELIDSWKDTITDMGEINLSKGLPLTPSDPRVAFDEALNKISRKTFAFTEKELRQAVLACGVGCGMNKEKFEGLFQKEIGEKVLSLGQSLDGKNQSNYYCTRRSYELEQKIFVSVSNGKNVMTAINSGKAKDFLRQIATGEDGVLKVSNQQKDAILFLATNKDRYCAIQGLAGTGKTYMLNYARQVLEEHGYVVKGACFTGKAANGLQQDANIPSVTLHSFLNSLEKEAGHLDSNQNFKDKTGWNLTDLKPSAQKEFWVVDEASMVDNVAMHSLMEAAKLKNAKVCFVGDRQQLLPVGEGNAFANMVENKKIATITLDDIRRQKENKALLESVKQVVLGGKDGVTTSFEILEKKNAVHNIGERKTRLNAMVKDFVSLTPSERESTVVLTAGNKDRKELNQSIRKALKANHELNDGQTFNVKNADGDTFKREFSTNDKVLFLKNDKRLGVQNGQTGFVEKTEGTEITIRCGKPEDTQTIKVNLDKYNYLDHGYVMTTHKAQGITEDRALINLDTSQKILNSRNSYYVDISRARYDVKIYTDDIDEIKGQVKDFAKKLTSDDFLIAESPGKKSPKIDESQRKKQMFENVIKLSKDTFNKIFEPIERQKEIVKENDLIKPELKPEHKRPQGPTML